jgi:hypothetical protein
MERIFECFRARVLYIYFTVDFLPGNVFNYDEIRENYYWQNVPCVEQLCVDDEKRRKFMNFYASRNGHYLCVLIIIIFRAFFNTLYFRLKEVD